MADVIIVRDRVSFPPHPAGQYAATCVDVVDLGERVESYAGSDPRVVSKLALVFATSERRQDGEHSTVSAEFTRSMHEKASLRRFLEDWEGRSYARDHLEAGIPLHDLVGKPALITVEHRRSTKGSAYAKIKGITPLPKSMPAVDIANYKRAPHWEDRRKRYEAEVAKHEDHARRPGAAVSIGDECPF